MATRAKKIEVPGEPKPTVEPTLDELLAQPDLQTRVAQLLDSTQLAARNDMLGDMNTEAFSILQRFESYSNEAGLLTDNLEFLALVKKATTTQQTTARNEDGTHTQHKRSRLTPDGWLVG